MMPRMQSLPTGNAQSAWKILSWKRAAAALLLICVGTATAWWRQPPDPTAPLRSVWSPYARLERQPAPRLGERVERWRIFDEAGHSVRALWRPAAHPTAKSWTVVMLGGVETDDRALLLLPADSPANVLSVSWDWKIPPGESLLNVLYFRDAALRAAAALALAMDAAGRVADRDRVALMGVSLGVPPALAALQLSDKARALVLIDGAADLEQVIRRRLSRKMHPPWLAAAVAAVLGRIIRPLEPSLNVDRAARLPALVINARRDKLLPLAAIQDLRNALPRADTRWRKDTHIEPNHRAAIAALSADVATWLQALP
jgi:dienelactone hydrolase